MGAIFFLVFGFTRRGGEGGGAGSGEQDYTDGGRGEQQVVFKDVFSPGIYSIGVRVPNLIVVVILGCVPGYEYPGTHPGTPLGYVSGYHCSAMSRVPPRVHALLNTPLEASVFFFNTPTKD